MGRAGTISLLETIAAIGLPSFAREPLSVGVDDQESFASGTVSGPWRRLDVPIDVPIQAKRGSNLGRAA